MSRALGRSVGRLVLLLAVCFVALQIAFALQIAAMLVIDPPSTTFQRSEAWRLAFSPRAPAWQQRWLGYDAIAANVKRAVIASEDAGFSEHSGVVLYRVVAQRSGQEPYAATISSTFVRREGSWKLAVHQQTPA